MKTTGVYRIIKVLALLGLLFSCVFVPPLLLSVYYQDGDQLVFAVLFVASVMGTSLLWLFFRKSPGNLQKKDAFLIAVLFWFFSSLLASLPFYLILQVSFTDALFEAVSGMTTTGATVLSGLDTMPKSLLFYRQELQWFGGMGLLVLAIAVIPQLGVGGMSIYKAEAPGPLKDEKLTPRVRHSAAIFWKLYLAITVLCALAYYMVGMSAFDAVAHSLSTVSTGGFSTHDTSLNYFNSVAVEEVACLFMLIGAINFSIHFIALKRRSLRYYWQNDEVSVFILVICISVLLIMLSLDYEHFYSPQDALQNAWFTVVSVITSTGFVTADFSTWPLFLPVLLIFIGFIGGCGGSTAGGLKVMRVYILMRLTLREMRFLLHPRAVLSVRLSGQSAIPEPVLQSVFSFLFLYVAVFVFLLLLMLLDGVDVVSAFSAIATCMNNMGPALGSVAQSFAALDNFAKWVSVLAMLMGRLEIVPFLILFVPEYWR